MRVTSGLIILLLLFCGPLGYSQDQEYADSLISRYLSGEFHGSERLEILSEIAISHPDPTVMLAYAGNLIVLADSLGEAEYQINGYLARSYAQRLLGQYFESLRSTMTGYDIARDANLNRKIAIVAVNLADLYSTVSDHEEARRYYREGVTILRQILYEENDSITLASTLYNFGDEYYKTNNLDSALILYQESMQLSKGVDYQEGVAYNLGSIGQVRYRLGRVSEAEENLKEAINILENLGDLYGKSIYMLDMAKIFLEREALDSAMKYANESKDLAQQFDLVKEVSEAELLISEIYSKQGLYDLSMQHYMIHVELQDSINIGNLTLQYEMEQQRAEVDLLKKEAEVADLRGKRQQWGIGVTGLTLLLVAMLGINTYRRYQLTRKTNRLIRQEKDRSEDLLLNILPRETAAELREKGAVKARKIDNVTVLFTDFVGFTRHAEKESPELMVRSIDFYFKKFDEITTRYNLEKIKTIGDSYMCAGGLHSAHCQAKEVIKAALEMVAVLEEVKKTREVIPFDMRIGVHTGSVVAGIVGTKKWQYDIWGDTVNIASGMEAKSAAGRVNISQTTYEEVKDEFQTEYRGESKIKNRGVVKMYFVS